MTVETVEGDGFVAVRKTVASGPHRGSWRLLEEASDDAAGHRSFRHKTGMRQPEPNGSLAR